MSFELRKFIKHTLQEVMNPQYGSSLSDYNKWKRNNVTYRGISSDSTLDVANGSGARFGDGLYTTPLSNKAMAKSYGTLYYVINGRPKNPKVFKDTNLAEIWIQQNLIFNKYKSTRDFEANTSISKEMLKLGYDGIEIKGREMVNFTPENVKYYANDNQLMQHYEHYIENKEALNESLMDEEYPQHFDMNYFKALKTFRQRIQYCHDNLQRINAGSSRIVYKIDDEKVLKLAKNGKGIAQNEVEIQYSEYYDIKDIVTRSFDHEENGLWVEMELARPLKESEFQKITGFKFQDYCAAIHNYENTAKSNGRRTQDLPIDPQILERMWEDEFVYSMLNFVGSYGVPAGDLKRISSYGIVKRDGQDTIVMTDFGLTEDVYSSHYAR